MNNMTTSTRKIHFNLNGAPVSADIGTHQNVVELLNSFDLCGARESCGQGLCGCCTVMVDGEAVSGCLKFAVMVDGKDVDTVEGLDPGGELDPVQEAFIEMGAFQCGFCTPGMILMTKHLLDRNPDPSDDQISGFLSGNLCRCAAYPEIIKAVQLAARKRKEALPNCVAEP
jgi:carbon-monoxide dehydrogenase small subunit